MSSKGHHACLHIRLCTRGFLGPGPLGSFGNSRPEGRSLGKTFGGEPASTSLATCGDLATLFLPPTQEANSGFVMKDSVINVSIFLFTIDLPPRKRFQGVVALPAVCLLNIYLFCGFKIVASGNYLVASICNYLDASCNLWRCGPLVVVRGLQSKWASGVEALRLKMWDFIAPTGNQTLVPCLARWIPNHWTTTEVPGCLLDFPCY